MFTGLVDDVGTVESVASSAAGRQLRIACRYSDLADGESVAVNGVCLTVLQRSPKAFTVAAMTTTLAATTALTWAVGHRVNLERALRPMDRMGGHFVQGHVDGVAQVVRVEAARDTTLVELAIPPELGDLMVSRGSVAVDGVSLTISAVPAPDIIQVALIAHTRDHTTLGALRVGDAVNVESDMIARHVRRLVRDRA